MLEALEIETGPDPGWSVIWLHGLGADGHDFESIIPELPLPKSSGVRFILPHAPAMRVRINGGASMRAWYDVESADLTRLPDLAGMRRSVEAIHELADRELSRGVRREHILLAGFSQGGVIALMTVFMSDRRWAGVLALSTYIPLDPSLVLSDNPTPLLMIHGTVDDVIPCRVGRNAFEALQALGSAGTRAWSEYPMGHSVCLSEIREIERWMSGIFLDQTPA